MLFRLPPHPEILLWIGHPQEAQLFQNADKLGIGFGQFVNAFLQVKLFHVKDKTPEELELFVENLMGKRPETRYEFIQQNASLAKNIDI
ncbi:MAG: hypothetical protein UY67_C0006G0059 [Candidatus Kaiserbacteria bacterium GW2011_GWA2_52_12]|uniref:Uncharacterized protein n=1 Tax=Candidatus Kaiserbacteria bacterium GW2011_GWA2_52_12 TaxID=1618671 RepID=A0A0G1ZY38_9BACT|nr:MAG: hypothetical protein UY67_C0006G0059 [Candidatus Kaiserbacteria bacterium GW2011_GWA2_52_12]